MCGRFTLRTPTVDLVRIFDLVRAVEMPSRYNIAPTQPVAAIRRTDEGRVLDLLHWGLIPSWADDPAIGNRMINARAETLAEKPAFRAALKQRRCLIPADGFYEWKKTGPRSKQPYHITALDGRPLAFAGLWEHWRGDARTIESCTIITGEPNELLAEIHDRMPVILDESDYDRWLDPRTGRDELQTLLAPCPTDHLVMHPVSTLVNNPRNEMPECIAPLAGRD